MFDKGIKKYVDLIVFWCKELSDFVREKKGGIIWHTQEVEKSYDGMACKMDSGEY